jgi:hypothetical protein
MALPGGRLRAMSARLCSTRTMERLISGPHGLAGRGQVPDRAKLCVEKPLDSDDWIRRVLEGSRRTRMRAIDANNCATGPLTIVKRLRA